MIGNYHRLVILAVLGTGLLAQIAKADSAADTAAVIAANNAFYAALGARDAAAMAKVYAHEPYVVNIGPGNTEAVVGWVGVEKWAQSLSGNFKQLTITLSDVHVHVKGDSAWVVAMEHAVGTSKDGKAVDWNLIATNVYENDASAYEKEGPGWLMVVHHSQPIDSGLGHLSACEDPSVGVVN